MRVCRGVQPAADQRTVAAGTAAIVGCVFVVRRPSGPAEKELGQRRVRYQVTVQVDPFVRVRQDIGSGMVGKRNRFRLTRHRPSSIHRRVIRERHARRRPFATVSPWTHRHVMCPRLLFRMRFCIDNDT